MLSERVSLGETKELAVTWQRLADNKESIVCRGFSDSSERVVSLEYHKLPEMRCYENTKIL